MKELGFDIGFIFQDDKKFEKGAKEFVEQHPNASEFEDVARTDRKLWQNMLATHRNALHSGDRRNEKHDPENANEKVAREMLVGARDMWRDIGRVDIDLLYKAREDYKKKDD